MIPEELEKIALATRAEQEALSHQLRVCTGTGCLALHSDHLKDSLTSVIKQRGLEQSCAVKGVGCMGLCALGPLVAIQPQSTLYQRVTVDDAIAIIDHLDTQPIDHLLCPTDIPFFQRQHKIVLENTGQIDPDHIEDYIAADGYTALIQALTEMTPSEVIEQVVRSGLRGRGGAGYPTGLKWSTVSKVRSTRKFVICNGDEGDPGAFMDRSVLESDPHRIIEGMALAAYAVGASEGFIYVRGEYDLAIKRLKTAIRQAERLGILGKSICSTTFDFHLETRLGAGAFVCGEETALIATIEGQRGNPRPRPPYPAEYGLWGFPTLINNVETLANIPPIIRNGGDWFAAIGIDHSKGTKVFSLTGPVRNTGLIEVPMGMTLREIIFEVGGGMTEGHAFKAVQTGGPSGGCLPEQHLDLPVGYDSLAQVGTIMGSGGMIVIDDTASMVDVARYFMEFCKTESCGKCVPCRVGTVQLSNLLGRFTEGSATAEDLTLLEELCDLVKQTSLCGLGQSAPNPVLSTLRYFRNEYLAHMAKGVATQ